VVTLELVSISCCVIGAFTQYAFGCKRGSFSLKRDYNFGLLEDILYINSAYFTSSSNRRLSIFLETARRTEDVYVTKNVEICKIYSFYLIYFLML
jgi:hypothetical protein